MDNTGFLQINVTDNENIPIENAKITLTYEGRPEDVVKNLSTNSSGQTENVELEAPPVTLSRTEDNIVQPYAEYAIVVEAENYEPLDISGIEVLSTANALQNVKLTRAFQVEEGSNIVIPAHTLYGYYPPKIAEAEIKPMNESGEIVLSRVVVPETVVVHDGSPSDSTAKDYYVSYTDYIKNVASSEIYATWSDATITANILAIMSFTLNRVCSVSDQPDVWQCVRRANDFEFFGLNCFTSFAHNIAKRNRGVEILNKSIELAADLGIRVVMVPGYDIYFGESTL